jgi:hypothetical protein
VRPKVCVCVCVFGYLSVCARACDMHEKGGGGLARGAAHVRQRACKLCALQRTAFEAGACSLLAVAQLPPHLLDKYLLGWWLLWGVVATQRGELG